MIFIWSIRVPLFWLQMIVDYKAKMAEEQQVQHIQAHQCSDCDSGPLVYPRRVCNDCPEKAQLGDAAYRNLRQWVQRRQPWDEVRGPADHKATDTAVERQPPSKQVRKPLGRL